MFLELLEYAPHYPKTWHDIGDETPSEQVAFVMPGSRLTLEPIRKSIWQMFCPG